MPIIPNNFVDIFGEGQYFAYPISLFLKYSEKLVENNGWSQESILCLMFYIIKNLSN